MPGCCSALSAELLTERPLSTDANPRLQKPEVCPSPNYVLGVGWFSLYRKPPRHGLIVAFHPGNPGASWKCSLGHAE
jgi:hypothetical protein